MRVGCGSKATREAEKKQTTTNGYGADTTKFSTVTIKCGSLELKSKERKTRTAKTLF